LDSIGHRIAQKLKTGMLVNLDIGIPTIWNEEYFDVVRNEIRHHREWIMSALPPKADIAERDWHVRFVPRADILKRRAAIHWTIAMFTPCKERHRVVSACPARRPAKPSVMRGISFTHY
jgi:hypothetical protein